jgi:putative hydrolase of the HAD superfamily
MDWLRGIRAVTFDAGGTLLAPWPSVGHVYAEVAAQHGHESLSPEGLNRQFASAWRAKKNFVHSRLCWLELAKKTFAGFLDEISVQDLFDDLYHRFAGAAAWRVFDDVLPTVDWLRKRGFKLGVVSNWDERLRPLLTELRLTPWFDAVVISVESGCAKPAPEIFHLAAEQLSLPQSSVLHVGDSATEDLAGAQSAGLHSLLLERQAQSGACPRMRSLRELSAMLERV